MATVPGRPNTPSRTFDAPDEAVLNWEAPSNGGAVISKYQIQRDNTLDYSSAASYFPGGTVRNYRMHDLIFGAKYYFRIRAFNAEGWGPYSSSVSLEVPNRPARPSPPTLTLQPPTSMLVNWQAPENNGSVIQEYEIQRSLTSDFSGTSTVSAGGTARTKTLVDLTIGVWYWVRIRARNGQGWSDWSNASSILVVAGPRIKVSGVYRNSVAYIKVSGVWRVAIPYVKVSGVWRVAGG